MIHWVTYRHLLLPQTMSRLPLFFTSRPLSSLLNFLSNSIHNNNHHPSLFSSFNTNHFSFTSRVFSSSSSMSSPHHTPKRSRRSRRIRNETPEFILKRQLDICSKFNNLQDALLLFNNARASGLRLSAHHYNTLLYLCSLSATHASLDKGFEIFRLMGVDNVAPNEATFTTMARLGVAKNDPLMAFQLVKKMKETGVCPKLRSFGPALFGFCEKGGADGAYEVYDYMVECGMVAEEDELVALLRVSVDSRRGDKVYEFLHRLRMSVRQVSEETAKAAEGWFLSETASGVGVEDWDVGKVREGIVKGGGGWHGQGWLGSGKWRVVKAEMDKKGVCCGCGERLVCIDLDPRETEDFARSLSSLASKKEVKDNFLHFKEWLKNHGPFDAVVDGANVGMINTHTFNFSQLDRVVDQMQRLSPSNRLPLVILHRARVYGGKSENPNMKRVLEGWRKAGALYATPRGSNDDWYWLYAAVSCKSLLVTNDEMRDHLFELLGNSIFPRWKEKHQVRMTVSRRGLALHMPPPYSNVIQESETGSWHFPTVIGDDIETPRQWLCATRATKNRSPWMAELSNLLSTT